MIDTEKYVKIISSQTEKPKTAESVGVEINNQDITITENGVYTASAGYTGIGTATVNVPQTEPVIESISITPTTSEQTITASGGTDGYSPITVDAVTSSIDSNITAGNIKSGVSILGVTGNVKELKGGGVSIAPLTQAQTILPTAPKNAFTEVLVGAVTSSIDANIQAGNIKSGVSILGVEGNMTPAPTYYVEKTKDANGVAQNGSYLMDLSTFTDVGNYIFYNLYYSNTNISGTINFSSLTSVSQNSACYGMFSNCTGITSVNLSALTTVSGQSACYGMFESCTGLTSVNISSLSNITSYRACANMFSRCTGLTSIDLSSLTTISGQNGCDSMFSNCTNLANVNISGLTQISGGANNACSYMFFKCKITNITFNLLNTITANSALKQAFINCSNLTSISFPALTSTSFGSSYTNQFNNMLQGVTGCTVRFPSNLQTVIGSWADVTAGFGGTNTTVLFDLTATS